MLKNYFLIALRNLFRNKLFSAVNILGLAIGLACCFIILLHIRSELSYDRFHEKGDNIYRLVVYRYYPDTQVNYALSPHSMGALLQQEMPEVKSSCRLFKGQGEVTYTFEDQTFTERHVVLADSNFFDMFSIRLLSGNPDEVLRNPLELILTETTAKRYFGDEDPLGKTITAPFGELQVVGVCEDAPPNSHFYFDFLASLNGAGFIQQPSYVTFSVYTYLEIEDRAQARQVEEKIPGLLELYASNQILALTGVSYEDYIAAGNGYEYHLQPLTSIHLHSHLNNEIGVNGNFNYIIIFISVAIFILIIASINFINLSTARSSERAKEVGIRKVVGSERSSLIRQFIIESVVIAFISLVFAVLIVEVTLPSFNNIAGTRLAIDYSDKFIIPTIIAFGLIVGLISGSYPALVLSSFKPISILKGKFSTSKKGMVTRKGLVIFQFFISISLISFTLLIFNQLKYMQSKNLGFQKENILVVRGNMGQDIRETFKQELERMPEVISSTATNTPVAGGFYFGFMIQAEEYGSDVITTRAMVVDEDFFETMDLEILDGRGFSDEFNDSLSLIINEKAAREFGLSEPVGAKIIEPVDTGGGTIIREYTIVGIMEDFHYNSLHDDLNSFVLQSTTGPNGFAPFVYIKMETNDWTGSIERIEEIWNEVNPDVAFTYYFLEDYIDNMYQSDRASGRLFSIFTLLAIIIACVGLFGLASYSTQQRVKEIGIRKVMGSSISKVVMLLSTDFAKLIAGAFLISIPIGILAMKFWLKNFSFSTNISLMIFIYAGLLSLLIALVTISYHTIRSASTNPSDTLRHE